MNIQDRLVGDPLGVVTGCLVWFPLAVWIVSIVHWLVSGEIDGLFGILALTVAIGLGVVAMNPPAPTLTPLIFAATLATVVLFPVARATLNRHALAAIDIEQLERFFEQLRLKPDNSALLIRIAELLFIRGFPANAVAIGEVALQGLPKSLFGPEHQMVSVWKTRLRRDQHPKTRCFHCGNDNHPYDVYCQRCKAPYIIEMARGKWLGKLSLQKIIVVWSALIMAFVGIPAATHLAKSNPQLALFAIIGQLVVGLVLVVVVFLRGSS